MLKKYRIIILCIVIITFCFLKCENNKKISKMKTKSSPSISKDFFGTINKNDSVQIFTLKNSKNISVKILSYGGIIKEINIPDRKGTYKNIVLDYEKIESYNTDQSYLGAIIGRYANRIQNGKFKIDNSIYSLAKNNNENHLHGGLVGFDKVMWIAKTDIKDNSASLILKYFSRDMEEGYPGNLKISVIYTLTNDNELDIEYSANTDKKTIINLTNHSYFNLTGEKENIDSHLLKINSKEYIPVDSNLIPIGQFENVSNSPFDFNQYKPIGKEINATNNQLSIGNGYDHCWVLNKKYNEYGFSASLYDKISGRLLEIYSDQPGIQVYSGNYLSDPFIKRQGICLETQHYPDSPNQKNYPSTLLNPNEEYYSKTSFKFMVE